MARIVVNTVQLNKLVKNLVAAERADEVKGTYSLHGRARIVAELRAARAELREYLKPCLENKAN